MSKKLLSVVAIVLFLSGCASGVTRAPGTNSSRVTLSTSNQVAAVTYSVTEEAKKKVSENLKFNPEELTSFVKRALEANSLLNGSTDKSRLKLDIQVKDVRVRSNFSAVMWGFMAGADLIKADIVIKDSENRELDRCEISVSYALGGLAGGQDSARMGWLYEKFAEETVKELTRQSVSMPIALAPSTEGPVANISGNVQGVVPTTTKAVPTDRQITGNEFREHLSNLGTADTITSTGANIYIDFRSDGDLWLRNLRSGGSSTSGTYTIRNDINQICLIVRRMDWSVFNNCYQLFDLGGNRFAMRSISGDHYFNYSRN